MKKKIEIIKRAIEDKKGNNLIIFFTEEVNPFFEAVVICDATSSTQINAIAQHIGSESKKNGMNLRSIQGDEKAPWVLVDLDDVIVHVFVKEERERMNIEQLYCDIEKVDLSNDI